MNACPVARSNCLVPVPSFCAGRAPRVVVSPYHLSLRIHTMLETRVWKRDVFAARVRRTVGVPSENTATVFRPRWSRTGPNRGRVCRGVRRVWALFVPWCPENDRGACT